MSSTVREVVLEAAFPVWLEAAAGQGLVTGRAGVGGGHGEDVTMGYPGAAPHAALSLGHRLCSHSHGRSHLQGHSLEVIAVR